MLINMKTSIRITHDEKVFIQLKMSSYYQEFINSIPDEAREREAKFRNGVSCIVWGSFYLEALINDTAMKVVEDGVGGTIATADVIWPFIETAKTEKKFEFVLETLMFDAEKRKRFARSLSAVFKIRNRLAHYNEPFKEVEPRRVRPKEDTGLAKASAQIDAAEKVAPDIVDAVLSFSVKERRKRILEIGEWLENAIFEYYQRNSAPHA